MALENPRLCELQHVDFEAKVEPAPAPAPAVVVVEPKPEPASASSGAAADAVSAVLEVMAEKTGYEVEMIEQEMDMEVDAEVLKLQVEMVDEAEDRIMVVE